MPALREVLDGQETVPAADVRAATAADLARASSRGRAQPTCELAELAGATRSWLDARPPETVLIAHRRLVPLTEEEHLLDRVMLAEYPPWARHFELFEHGRDIGPNGGFFLNQGHHPRQSPLPFQFHVFGADIAMVGVDFDDSAAGAWLITDRQLIGDLTALFVRCWGASSPLLAPPPGTDVLALVRVLASGLTDEVAAARLGISLRTYRRRLRHLTQTLGVGSRFAAGVEAERRGLVDLAHALIPADVVDTGAEIP